MLPLRFHRFMGLNNKTSQHNFYAYLWHAGFLALAQNFMDVDTIIPAMLIDAGGTSFQIGVLTAIMLGGSSFLQLLFTPVLSNKALKKGYLLLGINIRILALFGLGVLLYWYSTKDSSANIIWIIFSLITLFSVSGAFSAISYSDILGRSVFQEQRKSFLSLRQVLSSIGVLFSAYFAKQVLVEFDYPLNYSWLFLIAAAALAISSLGFWKIKEFAGPVIKIRNLKSYFQLMGAEIKENKRLSSYLLLVNSLGVSLAIMPFLILYGKQMFSISNTQVGLYLVLKVVAGVITGAVMFFYAKKIKYTFLLYVILFIGLFIAVTLLLAPSPSLFGVYFFLGGVLFTIYRVAIEGVLLEVSDHNNRTLNIGMVGAGNILPALFPVIGGWLIPTYGFDFFFILYAVIILFSVYFIRRLGCTK